MIRLLREEKFIVLALLAALADLLPGPWRHAGAAAAMAETAVLMAAILAASLSVVRHAELIARKLGDPYGSMVLTLSAVLVRDTIYSAVILDINGILGLAALIGGFKHGEQAYNDDSARTYGVMILTAVAVSMIIPEFIPSARWRAYSVFTIVVMVLLYGVFLRMQTGPHSYFFSYSYPEKNARRRQASVPVRTPRSAGVMIAGIAIVGLLAELMSHSMQRGLRGVAVPVGVVPLVIAGISAAPEILTALRAALANRMQSAVNIAMGASLSTVILTVPAMEAMALYSGQALRMAMTPLQTVMMLVTLVAVAINLNDGQTNAIEGMTHFVLFAAFLMLVALGL